MTKPEAGNIAGGSELRYKGVRKRKWGKWVSEVRLPNSRERIWLGSYDTPEKAARAFDAAVFCLRGRKANLNFPDNPPQITGGRSLSPQQIQAFAARYANEVGTEAMPAPVPEIESSMTESPAMSSSEFSDGLSVAALDWSFMDMLRGPEFPGFDEFSYELSPATPVTDDTEENGSGVSAQQSFLWNFSGEF